METQDSDTSFQSEDLPLKEQEDSSTVTPNPGYNPDDSSQSQTLPQENENSKGESPQIELPSEEEQGSEEEGELPSEDDVHTEVVLSQGKDVENPQEMNTGVVENEEDTSQTHQDTIFKENSDEIGPLAEIDFGVIESGRWLLKVVGGPNNGAEYYMHSGKEYVIGTDSKSCEIVLYDKTVSRQHAKISINEEENLFIEDLGSKNGVLLNGAKIEGKVSLTPGEMVILGTTSLIVYDREGEMQTIITPILPSIVKSLQKESEISSLGTENQSSEENTDLKAESELKTISRPEHSRIFYLIFIIATFFFSLLGFGIYTLFHEEHVVVQTQENANELIQNAMKNFSAVRWTFNKPGGNLLLLGHVLNTAEKNQILYNLESLTFIKNIDSNGLVIDEGVWNEINSLLSNNSDWKGLTIHSKVAGQFTLTGELKTLKQAEQLSAYLSRNFPYLDLLKKDLLVEEEIINRISNWLRENKLLDVNVKINNGEIHLTGTIAPGQQAALETVIAKIKQINGVRIVINTVQEHSTEVGTMDISDHYAVGGKSRVGDKFTVVINGRILSEGDELDGMTITKINAHRILLEKDNDKFRIDY